MVEDSKEVRCWAGYLILICSTIFALSFHMSNFFKYAFEM